MSQSVIMDDREFEMKFIVRRPRQRSSDRRHLTAQRERTNEQTEGRRENVPGAPVRSLSHCDGVDTLVDTTDTFSTVDGHECLHGAGDVLARGRGLVLCDFDCLHTCAETHCGVGLSETTDHTTSDTADKGGGTEVSSVEFGLGGDEEEDGALGGRLDPGPGNEALVDCRKLESAHAVTNRGRRRKRTAQNTTALPDAAEGGREAVSAVGGHGGLDNLEGLAEGGDLEEVQTGAEQQVGELDGLLLEALGLRRGSRDTGGDGGHGGQVGI